MSETFITTDTQTYTCTEISQTLYKLGGKIPTYKELYALASKLDECSERMGKSLYSDFGDTLLDYHTVISRWLIRTDKADLLRAMSESSADKGQAQTLLYDCILSRSLDLARHSADTDFLLDMMLVCRQKSGLNIIRDTLKGMNCA